MGQDKRIFFCPVLSRLDSMLTPGFMNSVYNTHNKRELLSSLQAVNLSPMYHLDSCEDQLKYFQRVVTGAMNRCLPMRLVKRHPTDKPWVTPEIKDAIKKRQRAWAKDNTLSYKIHRSKVIKLSKSGRRQFYSNRKSVICEILIRRSGGIISNSCHACLNQQPYPT